MIFAFGNDERPVFENGATFDKTAVLDGKGVPYAHNLKISINFMLRDADQESLTEQIADLESFWSGTKDSFSMKLDDGTPTAHTYTESIGGFRVTKPPSYMKYQNGEYVSYRTGNIEIEAMLPFGDLQTYSILEFSETLDIEGGGPQFGHLEPNEGLPVKQRLKEATLYRATQSGRIVYWGDYGPIPWPIFPDAQTGNPKIRGEGAKRVGNALYGFAQSYSYQFEANYPLYGTPNQWTA